LNIKLYAILFAVALTGLLAADANTPWIRWNKLEKEIRDCKISPSTARTQMRQVHAALISYCTNNKALSATPDATQPIFPIEGYTHEDIGGANGNGYYNERYFDFYDNTKKFSHAAHDLFIDDANFDTFSDRTGQPVAVLAMSDGIVVAMNTSWNPAQTNLRGGNYIWIFEPRKQEYFYYAHLNDIFIGIGYRITKGQKLGTVGRSGKNANSRRSITHLHISCIQYDNGRMYPRNLYQELYIAGKANAIKNNFSVPVRKNPLPTGADGP
jgi:peptidoglycan LD-endopeptidase LytH